MEPWSIILLSLAAALSLGWAIINGRHRANAEYRSKLQDDVGTFPDYTKRKLQRLLAPSSLRDRLNHATVIAGCVCIILAPVFVVVTLTSLVAWFEALLLILVGTLGGAYVGEFAFNSGGASKPLRD